MVPQKSVRNKKKKRNSITQNSCWVVIWWRFSRAFQGQGGRGRTSLRLHHEQCFLGVCAVGFSGSSWWWQDPCFVHLGVFDVGGALEVVRCAGRVAAREKHHVMASPEPHPSPSGGVTSYHGCFQRWLCSGPKTREPQRHESELVPSWKEFKTKDLTKEVSTSQLGSRSDPPSY